MERIYTDDNGLRYTQVGILKGILDYSFGSEDYIEYIRSLGGTFQHRVLTTPRSSVEVGEWVPPIGDWNPNAAIKWAQTYCHTKSTGWCAAYVRQMIEAGFGENGPQILRHHPDCAYKYGKYLPSIGFQFIEKLVGYEAQRAFSENEAKKGDIAVMSHGRYGHICMWTGKQWVSDFVQRNMWVYGGEGTCHIFRYFKGDEQSFKPKETVNGNDSISRASNYKKPWE